MELCHEKEPASDITPLHKGNTVETTIDVIDITPEINSTE